MKEKIKLSNCPTCDKKLDAVSAEDGVESPQPGDITVCFYCGEILKFSNDMILEKLPQELFDSFEKDFKEEILFIQEQIRMMQSFK